MLIRYCVPSIGGYIRIISFIDDSEIIKKILKSVWIFNSIGKISIDKKSRFGYLDSYCCRLIGVLICWDVAEADTQFTTFDLSALKKQCLTFFIFQLAYLLVVHPYGVPYTLDQAYPFVQKSKVYLGFPDVLFEPENAFSVADVALEQNSADLMPGLYPVKDKRQMQKSDMVQFEKDGRITQFLVKPETTDLKFSWILAIWKPSFILLMHDYLKPDLVKRQKKPNQAAIESGFSVFGHLFTDYHFIDVGNPNSLAQALREYSVEKA